MKIDLKHTKMNVKLIHIGIPVLFSLIGNGLFAQQTLLSSGGGSTNGFLSYSIGLVAFHTYTNSNSFIAEGIQHPFELFSNGGEVPNTLEINKETAFATGSENCFGAKQTITVAGAGNPVLVQSGATVRFIAGQSIRFLPGFHALESSTVHAFITTTGSFCNMSPTPSIVQLPSENEKSTSENPPDKVRTNQHFQPQLRAFPNPNGGQFTLEINNFKEQTNIEVFNMAGLSVCRIRSNNNSRIEINLPHLAKGIYNVRVTDGLFTKSVKMILQPKN